jgi:hypothetical protein
MLFWLFVLILLALASAAAYFGYRYYATGETPSLSIGGWFAPRPEPRLGVSEQATVDSRRRLVLIRRDDVEHLIMTGGPVDVVIETGISPPKPIEHEMAAEPTPPVFSRPPRTFNQAVKE